MDVDIHFPVSLLSSKVVKMDINFLVLTLMASYIVFLHIGSFMKPLLES